MSRTADALEWVTADPRRTQYQAAKLFGISQAAISQEKLKRSNAECPKCGSVFKLSDARRVKTT